MMGTAQAKVPTRATQGEVIQIKTKLYHPMETGWRKDANGNEVPRKRAHVFVCRFKGREVFRANFHTGVSADPYLSFYTKAIESGVYEFTWTEDDGTEFSASAPITVVSVAQ